MNITTIGIDLAKYTFSLHGVDTHGKIVFRKTLSRAKLMPFLAQQPPCLIGMEACSGAHYWARSLQALGHRTGIMASRFVAPYRKGGKNDGNDAEAICEAVARPRMRFVPVKSAEQQAILCLHRVRSGLIKERTALINHAWPAGGVRPHHAEGKVFRAAPHPRYSRGCREWIAHAGPTTAARYLLTFAGSE